MPEPTTCTHGTPEEDYCRSCYQDTLPVCAGCRHHEILNFTCSRCGARFCSRYCLEIIHPWGVCEPRVPCAICGVLPIPGGKPHRNHALWCEVYKLLKAADKVCATIDGAIAAEKRDAAELGAVLAEAAKS